MGGKVRRQSRVNQRELFIRALRQRFVPRIIDFWRMRSIENVKLDKLSYGLTAQRLTHD